MSEIKLENLAKDWRIKNHTNLGSNEILQVFLDYNKANESTQNFIMGGDYPIEIGTYEDMLEDIKDYLVDYLHLFDEYELVDYSLLKTDVDHYDKIIFLQAFIQLGEDGNEAISGMLGWDYDAFIEEMFRTRGFGNVMKMTDEHTHEIEINGTTYYWLYKK